MRKNILALLLSLVISVSQSFAFTTSLAQTSGNRQEQSRIEQEAAKLYNTLASLSLSERRTLFRGLTSELKSEIWKTHLRSYLSKHPDLKDEQKEVIQRAITFMNPELYDIPRDSPEFLEKVHRPMQLLEEQLLQVFSRDVAREILSVPGGPEPKQEENPTLPPVVSKKTSLVSKLNSPKVRSAEECGCSSRSDWCPQDLSCHNLGCSPRCCCGSMWLYTCNGECALIIWVKNS
jgi:hypothetical protein